MTVYVIYYVQTHVIDSKFGQDWTGSFRDMPNTRFVANAFGVAGSANILKH